MDKVRLLPTEKTILRDKLDRSEQLNVDVKRFKPAKFKNPVPQQQIGRYRPLDSRMCVTAEMGLIKQYLDRNQEPPGFLEAGPRKKLYFDSKKVKIGIVTPGGIAPGLNTVIHSIVNMHWEIYGIRKKACGFLGGFRGLAEERIVRLDPTITREWIHKGGTGIGAGREKQDISVMVTKLEGLFIDILYVIGGDGSLTVAHKIAEEIKKRKKKIVVAGIPKTMDNDVLWVWHSFGFDTAVEEATRLVNALHDEAKSTKKICLLPLFGRDAGFVAAHAALASGQVNVVLVPEVPFKMDLVLTHVQEVVADKGYALVVAAEGACPQGYSEKDVEEEIRKLGLDPNDRTNPKVWEMLQAWKLHLLKFKFEECFRNFMKGRHRVFVNEPRYLIRAIPAHAVDQIYCQRLADLAVHNTLAGFTDFMISQWLTEYVLVPLRLVAEQIDPKTKARQTKSIPPRGIFWSTVINSTGQPSFDC